MNSNSGDSEVNATKKKSFPKIFDINHSNYEMIFYWLSYLCISSKIFYEIIIYSQRSDIKESYMTVDIIAPYLFGLYQDKSVDYLANIKENLRFLFVSWICFVLMSRFLRTFTNKWIFSLGSIACSCFILNTLFSWPLIGILLVFTTVYIILGYFRLNILSWPLAIAFFISLDCELSHSLQRKMLVGEDDLRYVCFYAGVSLQAFRCVSLANELSKMEVRSPYTYLAGYHYVLYQVTYFFGPLTNFNTFYKRVLAPQPIANFGNLAGRVVRLVLWGILSELVLCLTLASAFFSSYHYLAGSKWQLFGAMYSCSVHFYLYYLQIYGWAHFFSTLDGFKVADWPSCVSRIHLYSDMWRSFDRGLYSMFKRNVYVPLGGGEKGLWRKIFASLFCFLLAFIYHGSQYSHGIFFLMNFTQILSEQLCTFIYCKTWIGDYMRSRLSPQSIRRCTAMLASFSIQFSFLGVIIFFKGSEVGYHVLHTAFATPGVLGYFFVSHLFTFSLAQLCISTKPAYERHREEMRSAKREKRRLIEISTFEEKKCD